MSQPSRPFFGGQNAGQRPIQDRNYNQQPRAQPLNNDTTIRQDHDLSNVPSGPRNAGPSYLVHGFPARHHSNFQRPRPYQTYPRHQQPHQLQQSYPVQQTNVRPQESSRPPPSALPAVNNQAWSSNADSHYSAMYDIDESSSIRKTRGPQGTNRQIGQTEASKGIKGRKFGYALIGKEAEQYITEDLRDQLASAIPPIAGDPAAPSPMSSTKMAPRMIVDEYRIAGHLDTSRKELQAHFQAEYKNQFLQSLQNLLLQHFKDMPLAAREKLVSQSDRLQENELTGWLNDSGQVADMIDNFLERLRGQEGDESSLFSSQGVIGSTLEKRLGEVIQAEKRRIEHRTADTSDEEGNSTPLNKGSAASGGSRTPMTSALDTT